MAKTLKNGLSMIETNPLNHNWSDFVILSGLSLHQFQKKLLLNLTDDNHPNLLMFLLKVLLIKFKANSLQKVLSFGIDTRQTQTRSRIKRLKDQAKSFHSGWLYLSLCQPMSILLECKMWVWCSCCFRRGIKSQYFLPVVNCDAIFLTNIFLFFIEKIRHIEIEIKKIGPIIDQNI